MKINYSILSGMLLFFGLFTQCIAALEEAVRNGDLRAIQRADHLDDMAFDQYRLPRSRVSRRHLLHVAAEHGHAAVYFYLLERALHCGQDGFYTVGIWDESKFEENNFKTTSRREAQQIMLDYADVASKMDSTALHHAIRGGFFGFALRLLQAGASANVGIINPIQLALVLRNLPMIQLLCSNGADLHEISASCKLMEDDARKKLGQQSLDIEFRSRLRLFGPAITAAEWRLHRKHQLLSNLEELAHQLAADRADETAGWHLAKEENIVCFLVRHGALVQNPNITERISPAITIAREQEVIGKALEELAVAGHTKFSSVLNQLILAFLSPYLRLPDVQAWQDSGYQEVEIISPDVLSAYAHSEGSEESMVENAASDQGEAIAQENLSVQGV